MKTGECCNKFNFITLIKTCYKITTKKVYYFIFYTNVFMDSKGRCYIPNILFSKAISHYWSLHFEVNKQVTSFRLLLSHLVKIESITHYQKGRGYKMWLKEHLRYKSRLKKMIIQYKHYTKFECLIATAYVPGDPSTQTRS